VLLLSFSFKLFKQHIIYMYEFKSTEFSNQFWFMPCSYSVSAPKISNVIALQIRPDFLAHPVVSRSLS